MFVTVSPAVGPERPPSGSDRLGGLIGPLMPAVPAPGPARVAAPAGGQRINPNPVFAAPVSTRACRRRLRRSCYRPAQYQRAYGLTSLHQAGITGAGQTIVILDSFGSPTIQHDLDVFDQRFHLPPTLVQIFRWGKVPPFNPKDPTMLAWASEATLDVQAAHLVAPGAKILLVETAVAETEGAVGVPEMMSALNHLVERGAGDVVSMSWATSESQFPGFDRGDYTSLTSLRYAFANARRHRVTLVAASGDSGGHAGRLDAAWPAGDPLVTSVGGTELRLDEAGRRLRPDVAWQGSGGELSKVFARPGYQDVVRAVVGGRRGSPDVSMAASFDGALWTYATFDPRRRGWTAGGAGTSESAPLFAGVVALLDQAAGRRFGQVNWALYRAYAAGAPGIVDVTQGRTGRHGFRAGPGYDLATGVGTVDAARLVRTVVRAAYGRAR